jgi:hypothetical protein
MTVTENFKLVNEALMSIIKMDDTETFDEQCDVVDALRKLRIKLKQKEVAI